MLNRIKGKIYFKFRTTRLILKNLLNRLFRLDDSLSDHSKIIVSLTSYPERFNYLYLTLESLVDQTYKPYKIILWLTKDEIKDIKLPKSLSMLEKRGIEIRVSDRNFKAYNKLIFSLREFPEYNIVTCDDDIIYPRYFLEKMYKKHKVYPNNIVAYRCTVMKKCDDQSLCPYTSWKRAEENMPSFDLFPTGVGGIMYPPNSLHDDVFDYNKFLTLSPMNDDIWFKAMALLNKTKTVMVEDISVEFPTIHGTQKTALWHENVLNNLNDSQLKKVFDYYNLYNMLGRK